MAKVLFTARAGQPTSHRTWNDSSRLAIRQRLPEDVAGGHWASSSGLVVLVPELMNEAAR
jgi:hypothetical protein